MEPFGLIFNPLKSKLGKDFIELIGQVEGFNYYTIDNFNAIKITSEIKPDIIYFILDGCCSLITDTNVEKIKTFFPLIPIIGVLSSNKICIECEFARRIFWNFITAPFKKEDILLTTKWFSNNHNGCENIYSSLKKNMTELFIGGSDLALRVKEKILKVAKYNVAVLIKGETGTGKELTAKMIHHLSNRVSNTFVPLNCGAVPTELFENELFGHKKGAYTNADSTSLEKKYS
jgi:two-component system, NtrC family, response regulator GlrR